MYAWYAGWVREQQVHELADLVLRRCPKGGFPAILCGDFNARPDSSEIRFLKGLQSLEGRGCFLLGSWEQGGEQCGEQGRGGETVVCNEAENGALPSDHFGVFTTLAG